MVVQLRRAPSRATIWLVAICAILIAGVIGASLYFTEEATPLTTANVTAEVTEGMDELQGQLPEAVVVSSIDSSRSKPCPDGSAGKLIAIERTIDTLPGFDGVGWLRELSARYDAMEGWTAKLETAGSSDRLTLTLANRALMLFTLEQVASVEGDLGHPGRIMISATSRCAKV